jgi:TPR repeat protein
MFRFGIGVEIDEQRALEHLIAAADSGESNAQIMLAHATAGVQQELLSVEVNDTATAETDALKYYRMAAANGRLVGTHSFNFKHFLRRAITFEFINQNR